MIELSSLQANMTAKKEVANNTSDIAKWEGYEEDLKKMTVSLHEFLQGAQAGISQADEWAKQDSSALESERGKQHIKDLARMLGQMVSGADTHLTGSKSAIERFRSILKHA